MSNKLTGAGVIVALVLGVFGLFSGNSVVNNPVTEKVTVGAAAGPDFYNHAYFIGGLTDGGGIYATSTSGSAVPLLANNFDDEIVIDVTLNVQDATLSFPASTTINTLPRAGDRRIIFVRNASTTAAMDLTFTGGTGMLFKKATTSAVLYGDTDGANFGLITLTRKANTDIEVLYTPFVD